MQVPQTKHAGFPSGNVIRGPVASNRSDAEKTGISPTPSSAPTTQTVADATKPLTDPAATAVENVLASATDATTTVESVASGAIATTTDAVAGAAATVSATVPVLPTVTVGDVVPSVPPFTP